MPKKRIKSSGNITKSGFLNSSFKKLSRKKESIAGKYFQIKTTPVQIDFEGNDYFNDADTYVFEEKTGVNNILGVTVVPLESDQNKFYITSDEKIRADGTVLPEYEDTLNKNYFVNNNIIDTPNELSLQIFDSTTSTKEKNKIFEELKENTKQEVYKPFVDDSLEEKFSNDFITNSILYDDENYYLGDQTSFVIELDFTNESDCHLVNTLLLNRNNDLPGSDINSINDSTSFNNQFNFTGNNSYSITSNFLSNTYWNNNLKRWEYNLDDNEYHVNSFKLNTDITFPNSITHNYNGSVDDSNTIDHLYTFLDKFIGKSFITHSPYYDRFNYLKNNSLNQKFNKVTETYGFPFNKRWNPNKDHLISLKNYIAREFLLEKVVFEGKISARSEIPVYTGNTEIVSNQNDFDNEKLTTLNNSEYNIVGANFYLLKSETVHEDSQKISPLTPFGYRIKKDTDTQTISQYTGQPGILYLDSSFSDLSSPLKLDNLKGTRSDVNSINIDINGNDNKLVFEAIQSSIVSQLQIDEENNNIIETDNSSFYYLENLLEGESINTQETSYLIYSSANNELLNYNVYNSNETQFKKKFTKIDLDKLSSKKELITESSIFFGKTKLNSDVSFEDYNNLTTLDPSDDLLINVEERNFLAYNTCFSSSTTNNISESNFSCISNLFQGQTIPQTNTVKRLLLSNREMLELFNIVILNYSNIRDEINSLYFETTASNFSEYSGSPEYLLDFVIFSDSSGNVIDPSVKALSNFTTNGINFRFKHEESQNNLYTLGDILTYDEVNDINYINTAILGNDAYCAKYRQIKSIEGDKAENSLLDLAHEPENAVGNLFDSLSATEKRNLFLNLITIGIYFSKINDLGTPTHLIEKVTILSENTNYMSYDVEFTNNIFDETKIHITTNNNIVIEKASEGYQNKFGNILFERTLTDVVQSFSPESIDTSSDSLLIDEISIVEGNSDSIENKTRTLDNIDNKDNSTSNVISSRSGKILSNNDYHQSKNFSYILKPEDDIVVGISSFSNFNTTASHIKFHDKIKITLYGKEIKEVKKNESSQSTNIKKVFVGNDTLQSIKEEKTSFKKEKLSISSKVYTNRLLSDSIFPSVTSIYNEVLGLSSESFKKDANDIYNNHNNSQKIIISDKNSSAISAPQAANIIKDWHKRFYMSISKETFDNKRFYSEVNNELPVNLYYDEVSYSVNNDYFYNNITIDLESDLENRLDFFTLKDMFFPTESIEITTENSDIFINDYSTKGILPNYNTNIKFIPEDNLYNINFENYESILPGNSSIQFLTIPAEFYIQNDVFNFKRKNTNFLRFKNIPSWCLVIELNEDSGSDLYTRLLSWFKLGFENIPQEYFDFYKLSSNNSNTCVFKKNKKISMQFSAEGEIIDRDFYLVEKSDNERTVQIVIPFRHSEIIAINEGNALDSYTYNEVNYSSSNNFTDLSGERENIIDDRIKDIIVGKLDITKFTDTDSENIVINDIFPFTISEMISSNIDFDDSIIGTNFRVKESLYELSHTDNRKDIVYNNYQFENFPIKYSEFIKNNNLSLIQRHILSDADYNSKKLKEFTANGYDIKIKNNIFYYTPYIYKKRGNYFVNTGIRAIFTIKSNVYAFETSYLNLLGVIYNNRILNTNHLVKSQYLIGFDETDVIRIYENASEKVYRINNKIQKNYFELDFSTSNGDNLLLQRSYFNVAVANDSLESLGTPIVNNIQQPINSLIAKYFLYGYRKSRKFKYPIDKFDGYRYGVLESNPVEFSYLVNEKHFGQFKDLKYDTQNYSRVLYGKGKEVIEQHCIEKEYYDEYFNRITKDTAAERSLFAGTNMDKHARSYYPFIESNTSEDNTDMQSLYT